MRRIAALLLGLAAVLFPTATTAGAADPQFTLTVDYRGLYPNADVDVPVTVQNPQSFPIVVRTATASVGDAGPGCPARNVEVATFTGDVPVPVHGTAIVPIHFHMLATAPEACQAATFPLSFRAGGSPASGASPDTGSGSGGFAFTGAGPDTLALAAGGAAALALGGVLIATRRRRAR